MSELFFCCDLVVIHHCYLAQPVLPAKFWEYLLVSKWYILFQDICEVIETTCADLIIIDNKEPLMVAGRIPATSMGTWVNGWVSSILAHASNFGIYGGNFINSSNVIIQSEPNSKLCLGYPILLWWFVSAHDQAQKIKDWLKAPDCSMNYNNATDKKMEGTGLWILKHPKYIEWRKSDGLLWIQGKGVLSYLL